MHWTCRRYISAGLSLKIHFVLRRGEKYFDWRVFLPPTPPLGKKNDDKRCGKHFLSSPVWFGRQRKSTSKMSDMWLVVIFIVFSSSAAKNGTTKTITSTPGIQRCTLCNLASLKQWWQVGELESDVETEDELTQIDGKAKKNGSKKEMKTSTIEPREDRGFLLELKWCHLRFSTIYRHRSLLISFRFFVIRAYCLLFDLFSICPPLLFFSLHTHIYCHLKQKEGWISILILFNHLLVEFEHFPPTSPSFSSTRQTSYWMALERKRIFISASLYTRYRQ